MKLKDLIAQLQSIQDEVGNGGKHAAISGDVELMCYENDTLDEYNISEIAPIRTHGCGCWIGAYIVVSRIAPNPEVSGPPSGGSTAPRCWTEVQ